MIQGLIYLIFIHVPDLYLVNYQEYIFCFKEPYVKNIPGVPPYDLGI